MLIFFHPFQAQDRIRNHPRAMECKENVQCTFLANRRAGARAFSCHPFQEQDRIRNHPKDDN